MLPLTRQGGIAATAILLSLAIVVVAQRDLGHRSTAEVRGSRRLWRLGASNAVVALAYLRWGRVPPRPDDLP